ncbi:MAG: rhomboid family intramembrane serine protease [Bilophila wadsworthia]
MTPPPRHLSPTRQATPPSRRPPLRRRKLRLWMRPYSVPRFWRMIDDGEKRPTLPPPHLFDLWITILASRNIPYLLTGRGNKLRLYVPALLERQARSELEAVLTESRKPRPVYIEPPTHNNAHWVLSVLLLLILWHGVRMHWGFLAHLPGLPDLPSEEWSRLGSLDVFRVKTFGEWYRCVTALTLHADSQHLFGNVLFGAPFLILLCRRVGLGLGLFLILLAGSFGNALNAWYRPAGLSASASAPARWACFPDSWPFKDGAAERRAIPESSPAQSILLLAAGTGILAMLGTEDKRITPHTCSLLRLHRRWEPQAGYHGVRPLRS